MPTLDVGTILKGLNDYVDYQRAQKQRNEKNAKIKNYMEMARESGADMTIDFDEQGNPKPKITYKHKSSADQMLEMLKVHSQVNKIKKETQGEQMTEGTDTALSMLPPRLQNRPDLLNKVPLDTSEFFSNRISSSGYGAKPVSDIAARIRSKFKGKAPGKPPSETTVNNIQFMRDFKKVAQAARQIDMSGIPDTEKKARKAKLRAWMQTTYPDKSKNIENFFNPSGGEAILGLTDNQ